MKKGFITRRLPKIGIELLNKHFEVTSNPENSVLTKKELFDHLSGVDFVLSTVCDRFDRELLCELPNLEVISNYAVGLDNVDVSEATRLGKAVYHLPDVVSASTADMTFALLLSACRQIFPSFRFVEEGRWTSWDPEIFLGMELKEKMFGIVGMGRVGQEVAKRAIGFDLNVQYFDPSSPVLLDSLKGKAKSVSFDEILETSDIISLHCPLLDQTRGMFGRDEFSKMEKKPIFMNMARGPIVVTDDLNEALATDQLSMALLDVTDPEPISKDHPIFQRKNLLVTPHIGTGTKECRLEMARHAALNILRHYGISG